MHRGLFGDDHPEVARVLDNLGVLMGVQARFGESRQLFEEGLDIRRRYLGPEHQSTLTSMNNLAVLADRMGDLQESARLHRQRPARLTPAVEDRIDRRKDEQSERRRGDQPTDDRQSHGPAQLAPGPEPHGHGEQPEHRRGRGHQNRPQAHATGPSQRLLLGEPIHAPQPVGVVHQDDGIVQRSLPARWPR